MDNAAVLGLGIVGKALADLFGIKKHFDIDENKSNVTLDIVARCRFVFICLPTPFVADRGYIIDDIFNIIKQIEQYGANCLYIIRSTVWPGFASHISNELGIDRVISNPEFLSEDTAEKDSKSPPFVLIGGQNPNYLAEVKGLYEGRIKGVQIILTDNITAELAKLALNGFFSTKVIYANTIYDQAQKLQANYETIKEVITRHPFGYRNHAAIWYKGRRGVNGRCLPKDLKALNFYAGSDFTRKLVEQNESYIHLKENENL